MNERNYLAEQFEENRAHLRSVAYRMLGSVSEVDDAVQEAWLRLSRAYATGIDSLGSSWLDHATLWRIGIVCLPCLTAVRWSAKRSRSPRSPESTRQPSVHGRP